MFNIVLGRTQKDVEKLKTRGAVYIGKQYVQMGQTSSLSNPIYMDVSRAHAMLVVGKRGGGKCIHPNTRITLSNNTSSKIEKIFDKFVENKNKVQRDDDVEEFEIKEDLYVKSFNLKSKKFEDKKVTNIYRRKVNEKLVRYNLLDSNLMCTKDHKILINENFEESEENLQWYSFNDILENKNYKNYSNFVGFENDNSYFELGNIWDEVDPDENIDEMLVDYEGYVYDISVEDNHNFIANDIVVHNSYTMGSIAEGLADMDPEISKNLSFVLLDTMGVYWSMKYPNKKEDELLQKWGLEGKGLGVQIYVPGGFYEQYKKDGVPVDFPFYIQPKELAIEDWMNAFKLSMDEEVAVAIQRVVGALLSEGKNFDIQDAINYVEKDERLPNNIKLAAITRFENANSWGIFSKNGTPIKDILVGGKVTVMDFSPYVAMPGGWEVKALVLGIVAKKIFVERMLVRKREELFDIVNKTEVIKRKDIKEDLPMPWLIVDEAHEFLPAQGTAASSQALITILREGRQPGVSLILATQQPAKIHTDAITQSDIVLAHRLTASYDLEALDKIFLSYNSKGSKALFNSMPKTKGCAIIMDDKNERLHTMQVKPRISWHGGEDPNAIRDVKDEFDLD